jgi:hypothetical protein
MPSPRARQEWANRVRAEYRSSAITARVLHLAIAAGLPRELLDIAHRIVRDELDHADLSHDCLVAIGGADHPIGVEFAALAHLEHPGGPLVELVHHILHSFCFGETLAVPLFRAMRVHTSHPEARCALDRILTDEAVHRAFGWQALDALLDLDPKGVRGVVQDGLPTAFRSYFEAYGSVPDAPPLTDAELAVGLLSPADYRQVFAHTWTHDITSRFLRRDVAIPPSLLVA